MDLYCTVMSLIKKTPLNMFNGKKYMNLVGNENSLGLTKQNIKSVCCMLHVTYYPITENTLHYPRISQKFPSLFTNEGFHFKTYP